MLFNGINLVQGSEVNLLAVDQGLTFPVSTQVGQLFYLTTAVGNNAPGLYVCTSISPLTWQAQLNTSSSVLDQLPNISPAVSGTYKSVTVDTKGRVTAGTNPTTLSGYGITDAQSKDADLTAIANLTGTGILVRTGTDSWAFDTSTFITASGAPVQSVAGHVGIVSLSQNDITGLTETSSPTFSNLILTGDLQVSGTTTTVNSTTVNITDLNLNVGAACVESSLLDGAGITMGNYTNSPQMRYSTVNDKIQFNKRVDAESFFGPLTGNVTGDVTGNVSGTASSITGTYTGAITVSQIQNALGFTPSATLGTVTSVAALTLTSAGTNISSSVTDTAGAIVISLNIPTASSTARGLLSSSDWTAFNNKQPSGNYLTSAVTDFSIQNANGVSATILNSTTSPSVTISLGAITPSSINVSGQITSGVITGTAPLIIQSTSLVSNLNADMLDDMQADSTGLSNSIVARDSNGDFTANIITASLNGTASYVTTNANLSGPITSSGNTTSINSQTGSGSKFVMDTSPTLVTPNIGVATGTSFNDITGLSSTNPTANGIANSGSETTVSRGDHVHPSDTTKLSLSGGTMTGTLDIPTGKFITIADIPTIGTSAANKNYVDAVAAGLSWKNAVKAATTVNITLSGLQTLDGVAVVAGDRVLVKDQTLTQNNGIYVVDAGTWSRAPDMDTLTPLNEFNGAGVLIIGGTTQGNSAWTISSTVTSVGTSPVVWAQFSGVGSVSYGTGFTLVGNTLSVDLTQLNSTDLGATTIGNNLISLSNPDAISFPRFNANNTVSALNDIQFRSAIGAASSSQNFYLGTTSVAIDRASADQALAGITSITGSAVAGQSFTLSIPSSTTAGHITVSAADSTLNNTGGGSVSLNAGKSGGGIGAGGNVNVAGGISSYVGGSVNLSGGGGIASGSGGDVNIGGGGGAWGGDVTINAGLAAGGMDGDIQIGNAYSRFINLGRPGAPINLYGNVSLMGLSGSSGGGFIKAANNGLLSLDQTAYTTNTGTVTSVGLSVPTGLSTDTSTITTSGTFTISYAAGYSIPTTVKQGQWDSAYSDRMKWDGGSSGITASTARTSIGASTIGSSLITLTDPGAVTFPRFNADNSVSTLDAATFRTAIGAGSGSGSVTSVGLSAPNIFSVTNSPVSTSGTLTLSLTSQTANTVFAGPTTGVAATPSFRTLVAADIPALNYAPASHTHSYQAADGDLLAIAGLLGTNGFLKKTDVDTWTLDTSSYLTSISFTGTGLTSTVTSGAVTVDGALNATHGGTGLTSYALGDIIFASAIDTLSKLPRGSDGQVLKLSGGLPSWGTDNNYSHPTGDGNLHVPATGVGNSGKVLTAGAGGGVLTWETPAVTGVTSVSVTTANGVSGTVTNPGTTPAISLTLGSITPSAIHVAGAGNDATNEAYGTNALMSNTTGTRNTAVGNNTLTAITTHTDNVAIGANALRFSTQSQNTAVGAYSLGNTTTGTSNVGVGYATLTSNVIGGGNTAIGYLAQQATESSYNTSLGSWSLQSNLTGGSNVAIGSTAMVTNTSGGLNTAVGANSLRSNVNGSSNAAVGSEAMFSNVSGSSNTAFGHQALFYSTGNNNTAIGTGAGTAITTGGNNTIIGRYNGNQNGLDIRTQSNFIVLADGGGNPRAYWNGANATFSGSTSMSGSLTSGVSGAGGGSLTLNSVGGFVSIYPRASGVPADYLSQAGHKFYVGAASCLLISSSNVIAMTTEDASSVTTGALQSAGGLGVTGTIWAGGDVVAYSDSRIKTNIVRITSALSKVDQLNGYTYDRTDIDTHRQTGVIAQEVLKVLPEAVSGTEETTYGVAYGNMVGLLIEAIKELKSEVTDLKAEISLLKKNL